jgi:predicted transcriptional regulator
VIVRILGEGQWELAEDHLEALNALDTSVEQAIDAGDHDAFAQGLVALLDVVRRQGTRLEDDSLMESDVILPMSDASLEEVAALLTEEGLVPD